MFFTLAEQKINQDRFFEITNITINGNNKNG